MITRHEADTPKHPNNAASCFVEVSLGRSNSDQPSVVVPEEVVVAILNLGGQIVGECQGTERLKEVE